MMQVLVKRRRYLSMSIIIALLIICSFPVFANSPLSFNSYFFNWRSPAIVANNSLTGKELEQPVSFFQELNLTEEQQQQLKQIHRQYRKQILQKKNTVSKLQQQLSDMMVGTESVELLRAKNQQLIRLRQELGALRFESMLATREILTPQQRQKFRELVNSRLEDN